MAGEDILIVDDNAANAKLLDYLLRAHGYATRTAPSADDALAALGERMPDMILMDIQLPGTDGLTLTRRLRADPTTRHVPIIAVSAYAMKGDAEKSLAAGCNRHLTKPIDRQEILAAISAVLAEARGA